MTQSKDEMWRPVAETARSACDLFGVSYGHCLPGEPGSCGLSAAMHAAAYLIALQEVAAHQLQHLGITDDRFPGLREIVRGSIQFCHDKEDHHDQGQ